MTSLTRRRFLAASAATGLIPAVVRSAVSRPAADTAAFFLVGDTHYLADKADPGKLDLRSAGVTARLVETLNRLPGTAIPAAAGGGKVSPPRGVIHAGDVIDTGDKSGGTTAAMQAAEWSAFADGFGLTGRDGRLKFPVYEVHGNHDSPRGDGLAVKKIVDRNKHRPGVANVSPNGLHYSWDWGGVHFLNLGIVVGEVKAVTRKRRYAPLGSLAFLVEDLKRTVGASGRPVVVTHHVDVLRYSLPLPIEDRQVTGKEWDPADVKGFHDALKGYAVAAVLYGHTHVRNVYRWDGSNKPAAAGVPVFNVDNSSHFASRTQGFFYFEVLDKTVTVREYQTADAWETGFWTPQVWTAPGGTG